VYIGVTVPFRDSKQRAIHYQKHGHRFGARDEYDYERIADAFMAGPLHPNLFECYRITGTLDRIRLDGSTRYYGVAYNISVLRTFHIKDASQIAARGGPHGFVQHKCSEVRV
jgi:hypothetical protein